MFIKEFSLTNYLSHQTTRLVLSPVTAFVGPCNSGKSAIFDGLINFSMLARGRISEAFSPGPWSFYSTRNRQAGNTAQVGFNSVLAKSRTANELLSYTISYRQTPTIAGDVTAFEILAERLAKNTPTQSIELYERATNRFHNSITDARSGIGNDAGILRAIRNANVNDALATYVSTHVGQVVKYRMQTYYLRQPSFLPDIETQEARLRPNGAGLAAVLYQAYENKRAFFDEVSDSLRKVVAGFEGFEFNQTGAQEIGFSIRFNDGRGVVSAARISDGTLHLLGLVTLLKNPSRPSVICLEEPEIGLNSAAVRELVTLIRGVAERPEQASQILLSTHSPYLLRDLWHHGLEQPLDSILYTRIVEGISSVVPVRELHGINHFNVNQPSIAFAANLLDGKVNSPESE